MKYKRIILKLSGEALADKKDGTILDNEKLKNIALAVKQMHDAGVQIGIVIGAGNIFRGKIASKIGIDQTNGDYMEQKMKETQVYNTATDGVYPIMTGGVWTPGRMILGVQIFPPDIHAVAKEVGAEVLETKIESYFMYKNIAFFKHKGGVPNALYG